MVARGQKCRLSWTIMWTWILQIERIESISIRNELEAVKNFSTLFWELRNNFRIYFWSCKKFLIKKIKPVPSDQILPLISVLWFFLSSVMMSLYYKRAADGKARKKIVHWLPRGRIIILRLMGGFVRQLEHLIITYTCHELDFFGLLWNFLS